MLSVVRVLPAIAIQYPSERARLKAFKLGELSRLIALLFVDFGPADKTPCSFILKSFEKQPYWMASVTMSAIDAFAEVNLDDRISL